MLVHHRIPPLPPPALNFLVHVCAIWCCLKGAQARGKTIKISGYSLWVVNNATCRFKPADYTVQFILKALSVVPVIIHNYSLKGNRTFQGERGPQK